jgi:hypothetical protein
MAKTFGTGTDPKGLVNRGVEGSGAAQIFRPSQAVQDFVTRQARGEQQKAAQKKAEAKAKVEKQKVDDKAIQDLLDVDFIGWNEKRNKQILGDFSILQDEAAQEVARGGDISQSKDLLIKKKILEQKIDLMKLERTEYSNAVKDLAQIAKDPDYDPVELKTFADNIGLFEQGGIGENDFSLLIRPTKKIPIDLFKELKNIDIGYFTQADIDAETGLGEKSKTVVKDKLKSQSESLINAKPKVYEYGISQGLWTNKEEAADWFYRNKFYQADTSKEDIVRTTSKSNMFGTGSSSKEIEEDFNKWKQDLKNGDENAASFLFNIQLPTGTKVEGFKVVPTVEQEQGYAAEGFAPRIKYMFKAAKMVDGKKLTENLEIEPLIEDDTQLYKFYISAVKDKNRTYGKDVAERTSKTKVIQDKPKTVTGTPKEPTTNKFDKYKRQ